MSEKNSKARKKYWASLPKAERSKRMSLVAKNRYKGMDETRRKEIGAQLALSRKKAKELALAK